MSKYWDSKTETFKPIPAAPFYVLSNDVFMSDWGIAKGKTNICVVPCQTRDVANGVADYLKRGRTDQKRIRIITRLPQRNKSGYIYSLLSGWIAAAKREGFL